MGDLSRVKERSSCRLERPKNRDRDRRQSVRSSVSKLGSHRNELNRAKASNDRWSQGTQEDGLRRNKDE
jgi:hypothetical protein